MKHLFLFTQQTSNKLDKKWHDSQTSVSECALWITRYFRAGQPSNLPKVATSKYKRGNATPSDLRKTYSKLFLLNQQILKVLLRFGLCLCFSLQKLYISLHLSVILCTDEDWDFKMQRVDKCNIQLSMWLSSGWNHLAGRRQL